MYGNRKEIELCYNMGLIAAIYNATRIHKAIKSIATYFAFSIRKKKKIES